MMRNFIKLNPSAVKLKRNVIIGTKLAYTLTYFQYKKNNDVFKRKEKDLTSGLSLRHMNPSLNRLRIASYGRHPTDWETHLSTIHLSFNLYLHRFLSSAWICLLSVQKKMSACFTKENNFLRSPFHCDGVFFALLPQEKAFPLPYLCPVEQVGKGSRTRGALSTSERSIF